MGAASDYMHRQRMAVEVSRTVGPDDVRRWTNLHAPDLVILPLIDSCAEALVDSWSVYSGPGDFMSARYVDGIADAWHTDHHPVWCHDESVDNWVIGAIGEENIRAAMRERGEAFEDWGLAEFAAYELTGSVAHAFRVEWDDTDD